jgi:hypothetical protein
MSNRDQDELVLNPLTGQLDFIRKFNPNRIVTHSTNQADNLLVVYDMVSGTYLPMGPVVVTDNDGNVVTT